MVIKVRCTATHGLSSGTGIWESTSSRKRNSTIMSMASGNDMRANKSWESREECYSTRLSVRLLFKLKLKSPLKATFPEQQRSPRICLVVAIVSVGRYNLLKLRQVNAWLEWVIYFYGVIIKHILETFICGHLALQDDACTPWLRP